VPSELAVSIAATAPPSTKPGSRDREGFGGAFGTSSDIGSSSGRRPAFGAERHPSMHIAAQIASATSLGMVGPSAAVAAVVSGSNGSGGAGSDGLPSILEVDVSGGAGAGGDGGPASVRAYKVEIEEH
jgi:hypothetical protein